MKKLPRFHEVLTAEYLLAGPGHSDDAAREPVLHRTHWIERLNLDEQINALRRKL